MKQFIQISLISLSFVGCGGGSGEPIVEKSTKPINLADNQHVQYPLFLKKNKLYEVKMEVKNCKEKPCCSLEITNGSEQQGFSLNYDKSSSDTDNTARILLDSPVDATVYARVRGIKNCKYVVPVISFGANVESAESMVTAQGQTIDGQAKIYPELAITKLQESDNHIYLRDTSRRGNDGLSGDAAIQSKKFVRNVHQFSNPQLLSHRAKTSLELDSQGVDAYAGSLITFDYFKDTFGIRSYDNEGSEMIAVTHLDYPIVPTPFCGRILQPGTLFNAFWNGSSIAYTPTVNGRLSLASALSVTAHEWGHAITGSHSKLQYSREPGALNEAFSDWIGVAVAQSEGSSFWTVGEEIGTAIRSLKEPTQFNQPDTYKGVGWQDADFESCPIPDVCTNDYCGVHVNSGVPNKMFYLLANGGEHNNIMVSGLGIETAIKIAFDATANYWTSTTNFANAKIGMASAAESYGANAVEQVNLAWQAVGV